MNRDVRLDLVRGYAMLAIAVNHVALLFAPLGFSQLKLPTLTALGYSSAASLFFALSGYMIGLVYLRRPGAAQAILRRVRLIYLVNLAVFLVGLGIALWQPLRVQIAMEYDAILESPLPSSGLFLAMLQQPALLDVLHMYVILMTATPLVAFVLTRRPAVALLACAVIYVAAQLFPDFAPPAAQLEPTGEWSLRGEWNMNLLAWQLLFFGSMYAGTLTFHEKVFAWVAESTQRRWTIFGLFAVVAVIKIGDKFGYWGTPPLVSKTTVAPLNLLHFGLTMLVLSSVIVMVQKHFKHPISRVIAAVGRQTLYGFAVSIPATYLAAGFWAASGATYAGYLLSCLFVSAVVIAFSCWLDAAKRRPAAT